MDRAGTSLISTKIKPSQPGNKEAGHRPDPIQKNYSADTAGRLVLPLNNNGRPGYFSKWGHRSHDNQSEVVAYRKGSDGYDALQQRLDPTGVVPVKLQKRWKQAVSPETIFPLPCRTAS